MKNVIRVLAKEVRRVRALVEVQEDYKKYYRLGYGVANFTKELNDLRRRLAMLIKEAM